MPDAVNIEVGVSGTDDSTGEPNGDNDMAAIDLPENVAGVIIKAGSESFQALMTDINNNGAHIHNVTRGSIFRRFDETGVAEGKTQSGVLATDVGGPTNKGK